MSPQQTLGVTTQTPIASVPDATDDDASGRSPRRPERHSMNDLG
jgi:hypothetical protein